MESEWEEYTREVIPLHVLAPLGIGIVRYSGEMIGEPFTQQLLSNEGSVTWWGNYKADIENVGGFLLRNFRDDKFAREYFEKYNPEIVPVLSGGKVDETLKLEAFENKTRG